MHIGKFRHEVQPNGHEISPSQPEHAKYSGDDRKDSRYACLILHHFTTAALLPGTVEVLQGQIQIP
jgi:hypothetical protein